MVRVDKHCVDELVKIFKMFRKTYGMEINWDKSCAYWFDKYTRKSGWLTWYNWKWAEEGDLSQILGTPFGLNFNTSDID